jgi:hypothetical protein
MMAGLLAACSNNKKQPPVSGHSVLADSADQVMWGARFNLTDRGLQRAELIADTAFFFNDNTRVELVNVHTTFFTTAGAKDAVLTSATGTYSSRSGSMVARKHVVVISEDGRRLTTALSVSPSPIAGSRASDFAPTRVSTTFAF